MAYTKLFPEIITSSIWCESNATRILWITFLAMADKNGEVMGSAPGLARVANIPLDECRKALEILQSPDPDSRTPDCDGRRIEAIPGGFSIINYAGYRARASKEDEQAKNRERQKRHYERKKNLTEPNGDLTEPNGDLTQHRDIAEAEAEAKAEKSISSPNGDSPRRAGGLAAEFERWWEKVPNKIAKGAARKAWVKARSAKDPPTPERMVEALISHEKRRKTLKDPPSPIHPATFWNQERWADEMAKVAPRYVHGVPTSPQPEPDPMPPDFITWFRETIVDFNGNKTTLNDEQIAEKWREKTWRDEYRSVKGQPRP